MSKIKVKKVKIPSSMNDENLADMFNQMLGTGSINMSIAYPRYLRMKVLCEQLIRVFELFAASPFMRTAEFSTQKEQMTSFCKSARKSVTKLFCIDLKDYEWNLTLVESNTQKDFAEVYDNVKRSDLVNTFIIMCDRLVRYKKNFVDINALNHKFISLMPGAEWYPFPFTTLNLKYIVSLPYVGENTITFFITTLHKAYELSKSLFEEIHSPDIDVNQFSEVIMRNIEEMQKRPELHRCRKAFDKIKQSISLLETNFSTYYRDFIGTKDSTIMMQHFIIDVSKSTDADAQVTQQFRTIIAYYKKIAQDQITNPKVKMLFDKVNESFKHLERGTENLVDIPNDSDDEVDSDIILVKPTAVSADELAEDAS